MLRTVRIRIKDQEFKKYAIEKVFTTRHFENILILLLKEDHKHSIGDFKLLTNYRVMRAVINDNKGGKLADKVQYIKDKYKDNELMKSLIEVGQSLKTHNFAMTIKKIKGEYKGFFTKLRQGDTKARPPQTKKLSRLKSYTLLLDNSSSYSLTHLKKGKNKLGINLDSRMKYIYMSNEVFKELVGGDLEQVQSINLHYRNRELYLMVTYHKEIAEDPELKPKPAGLDIGVNVLAALYIGDNKSPSLLIDGKKFKHYNSRFNRFIGKLAKDIDTLEDKDRVEYLKKYRSYLFEKRNRFFFDQFHKMSKRILEYLSKHKVTKLVISDNLPKAKNKKGKKMDKVNNQKFIQIPFGRLLDNLEYKAEEYGIKVTIVNEAYSSKSNSMTDDIIKAHGLFNELSDGKPKNLTNADKKRLKDIIFQGRRVKRGLYLDKINNVVYHSDLNGAKNILKLSSNYRPTQAEEDNLQKLCNPIKIENDFQFRRLIKKIV